MRMKLYKHENCTDVAIEILKSFNGKDFYKLKVSWWNVVNKENHYPMGVVEKLKISLEDWKKWKLIK